MDLFNKKKIEKIQTQLNVYKSLYEKERCKKQELTKITNEIASDGLRHGSSEAGKYLVNKRKK
ncbi:hypothetical protein [Streptococcus mutans]|uniref:hypothetical protein n=1 Tax=Streptococcus mutans TaxID=1309 RepID=UPI0002B5F624|nr:hypothetical protein [Streptococcus mutans]EMC38705.1 hypothetical protein SMU94_05616 [Streptococcus mutans 66-2A]MCB5116209.1 hypothetical protein [Streptococcus mutans]MDW5544177.1 hypothetical protein [Streptococcus mutans]MDW5547913.1 hypothetical protein [Streptococcus mutans]